MKHGAHAQHPRRQGEIERQLAQMVPVKDDDGKPNPADQIVIRLLAVCLARLESVSRYTTRHGAITRGGRLAASAMYEEKLIVRAQNLCAELGMSPRARVALGLQIKQAEHLDLATLMSELPDAPRRTRPRPDDIEGTTSDD